MRRINSQDLYDFDRVFFEEGARLLCGIDEAGRGPLAGPVAAAAVIFAEGVFIEGVADSKTLAPEKRERLYEEILSRASEASVGIASAEEIDRLNILAATHLAAGRALGALPITPVLIITEFLKLKDVSAPVRFFARGDALSHAIASASILAKVARDRLMMKYHEEYPMYGFAQNKGYGTKEHLDALRKWGPCPIHRRSFKRVLPERERISDSIDGGRGEKMLTLERVNI
ncbi:MAG TPA: ribonuclease HII [Candidatus Sumerlaeia bacterium]|nr:ribonuclease HII [Candidatus Sumerlaeia bacterium]